MFLEQAFFMCDDQGRAIGQSDEAKVDFRALWRIGCINGWGEGWPVKYRAGGHTG